jgi:acetylornithine deacetylase/succinyl-diaminopimelate desuccinylase-like protein
LPATEFGRRFHGHNERVDVESLSLTTHFWRRVIDDFLG